MCKKLCTGKVLEFQADKVYASHFSKFQYET